MYLRGKAMSASIANIISGRHFDYEEEIKKGLLSTTLLCHGQAVHAGWFTDLATGKPLDRNVPEMIALIHSEISEALEGYRKGQMDDHLPDRNSVEVELADAIIRIADLAGYLGLDLGGAVVEKLKYNRERADHKLENRAKEGGKKF